jgi:hypothetical protein
MAIGMAFVLATAQVSFTQAQAAVSDADLETFAAIYVDLLDTAAKAETELASAQSEEHAQQIRTRVQSESVAKVAQRGWTPEKFNSVGDAINKDPALTEKAVKLIEEK